MKKIHWTDLIISVVLAELVGALSALFSGGYGRYEFLIKPPLSPPAIVFPIVWAVLYALMGISIYIIYHSSSSMRSAATGIYVIQLALNFTWSIIFFRFGLFTVAAVISVILALFVGIMVQYFRQVNKTAGFLNIPYFLWSLFAVYLATGTAFLN